MLEQTTISIRGLNAMMDDLLGGSSIKGCLVEDLEHNTLNYQLHLSIVVIVSFASSSRVPMLQDPYFA